MQRRAPLYFSVCMFVYLPLVLHFFYSFVAHEIFYIISYSSFAMKLLTKLQCDSAHIDLEKKINKIRPNGK